MLITDDSGLLVKPDVARKQLDSETVVPQPVGGSEKDDPGIKPPVTEPPSGGGGAKVSKPRRFHGTVTLDPTRTGRDASRIADEVISHLAGIVGASVRVTLEIEADVPNGVPDNVVRTVTENSKTLKFSSQGFEKE
jgi:hypothetical protein